MQITNDQRLGVNIIIGTHEEQLPEMRGINISGS
jgi:hypothetical protein